MVSTLGALIDNVSGHVESVHGLHLVQRSVRKYGDFLQRCGHHDVPSKGHGHGCLRTL